MRGDLNLGISVTFFLFPVSLSLQLSMSLSPCWAKGLHWRGLCGVVDIVIVTKWLTAVTSPVLWPQVKGEIILLLFFVFIYLFMFLDCKCECLSALHAWEGFWRSASRSVKPFRTVRPEEQIPCCAYRHGLDLWRQTSVLSEYWKTGALNKQAFQK